MNGRQVQDALIRFLSDATLRAAVRNESPPARRRPRDSSSLPPPAELSAESRNWLASLDRARVERLARFISRNYYRAHAEEAFRHARALAPIRGRAPEEALAPERSQGLFDWAVLGSRQTAADVADAIASYLMEGDGPMVKAVPYWRDLLRYEHAVFVAEAGRVPRRLGTAPIGAPPPHAVPHRQRRAQEIDFEYDLLSVLALLRTSLTVAPAARQVRTRILLSRDARGRATSLRASPALEAVLKAADGKRDIRAIAQETNLDPAQVTDLVRSLTTAGALTWMID